MQKHQVPPRQKQINFKQLEPRFLSSGWSATGTQGAYGCINLTVMVLTQWETAPAELTQIHLVTKFTQHSAAKQQTAEMPGCSHSISVCLKQITF